MRVSLNWLSEFVDLPTRDAGELARALAMAGHEVDGVELVEHDWSGVKVARVDEVAAHPNADKVRVCEVSLGNGPITVVCGAWNFDRGAIVAFAEPGAVLAGGFEIGVRTIRGVESHGMICSEAELGLGEDHSGIIVLEDDTPLGAPLEDVLDLPDVVFDLDITPNRPDAMSVLGIARDLAAWYGVPWRAPAPRPPVVPGNPDVVVTISDPFGNPRFVARQVDGVEPGPSPFWIRRRLTLAGVRPISNLVDVSNYVMLELGQPLHVFDADTIVGGKLDVRRAVPGEQLVTLDDVTRTLSPEDLVICDEEGPTSLAGTMGGARSEVSADTSSILIEAAGWDPPTIMYMSRRHALRSEASARFERGVDPELPPLASLRAAELILHLAGGFLRSEPIDQIARPFQPRRIDLSPSHVTRLLGNRFDSATIKASLSRLGFEAEGKDPISVVVPSFRPDVSRPVDLVEEVARLADYDTFGERLRLGTGGGLTDAQDRTRRLAQELTALGFSQAVNLSFVMPAEIEAFNPPAEHDLRRTIGVKNPLSDEEALLRTSLLPGLVRTVRHNRNRGRDDVAVFELGRVFLHQPWPTDRRVPDQPQRLAMVAAGSVGPTDLAGHGREADIFTMTAVMRHLSDALGLGVRFEADQPPGFHPTRAARIVAGDRPIGRLGELHPLTVAALGLEGRVVAAEIDLEPMLASHQEREYLPVSSYPPADFDLSFEVPVEMSSEQLVGVVRERGGDLVETVRVFDEFQGGSLEGARKALAVRVRLRALDRTLQTGDIATIRDAMVEAAGAAGARLRGSA